MSDRVEGVPTLDERIDDIRAVMEAVGSDRAPLFGMSEGGSIAALFAATYPGAVSALIILGSGAVGFIPKADVDRVVELLADSWGTGASLAFGAPSVADDERLRQWSGTLERRAASPGTMAALLRMNADFDIQAALSSISAPTLVLHRTGDLTYAVEHGRYLAEHIVGARFVELAGTDHLPYWEEPEAIVGLIEEFVTGSRRTPDAERVLATTLFTDIVSSTDRASRVGDRRWRETLDDYDDRAAKEIERFGGRLIKTTGDGSLATFDGPTRAVRFGCAIRDAARQLGLDIRAGMHTGEIELRGDDVTGLGVVIGQRVSALAGAEKCSRRARSRISPSGQESRSQNAANTNSRACPAPGASSSSTPDPITGIDTRRGGTRYRSPTDCPKPGRGHPVCAVPAGDGTVARRCSVRVLSRPRARLS